METIAETAQRMCTTWLIEAEAADTAAQEIVTLTSYRAGGGWIAIAARSWVSDLAGTGLEADQMDPVIILEAGPEAALSSFHEAATAALAERRATDYEVADLFVLDP